MSLNVRPFRESDYAVLAEIQSLVVEEVVSPDSLLWSDEHGDPRCRRQRWVAEWEGRPIGVGGYSQVAAFYHPQKFDISVVVLPEHRRRGIGSALLAQVLVALEEHDPIEFGCAVREDWPDSITFAVKRGFAEQMRNWESHLDLARFDPAPFGSVVGEAAARGYQVCSYAELVGDPELDRKLHALVMEVRRDIPAPDPWQDTPFETWLAALRRPHFFPEGYFIGMKDGEWVGISALWKTDEPGTLSTGMTAVKRAHRGTGIAKALKVRAIGLAKERGFATIKTWNESNNQRMLAINGWLGFERKPAWILFGKEMRAEG